MHTSQLNARLSLQSRLLLSAIVVVVLGVSDLSLFAKETPRGNLRPGITRTALDEYVAAADDTYDFSLVRSVKEAGVTLHTLNLKSQTWLTTNEVDSTVWQHALTVIEPEKVEHETALLFITGGANNERPRRADPNLVKIASATKSIVAELSMVPNQPLVFQGDPKHERRYEDSLIAYTWDKFLRTGDAKWPARLPMTKAAVRAMDCIQEFAATQAGGSHIVRQFVISGASKRGWTTWTAGAVDKRVAAIIPLVIDVLNVIPSMMHHYAAYGFWAPAIRDYERFNLMEWSNRPEYKALMRIEDPYEYRDRLTMPKFIINACGDQFFLPDSSQFYFADLQGPKYLRYIPNTDHSLRQSDAVETVLACYQAVLSGTHLPEFTWSFESDGSIQVSAKDKPSAVKLWQAANPKARDFRLETIGPKWQSSELKPSGETGQPATYKASIQPPSEGWAAFMVELTYPSAPANMKFTTSVRVLPGKLPFKYTPPERPSPVQY